MNRESRAADAETIYLSDVDPHSSAPIHRVADLRARLLLHVLFADSLLIGDSQSLNNPFFRALVCTEEARRVEWPAGTSPLPDLAPLLRDGRMRVALRAGPGLRAIREQHEQQRVDNVPSRDYVEWLDGLTAGHVTVYDPGAVTAAFTSGLLDRVDAGLRRAEGAERAVLESVRQWSAEQDALGYKALRDWISGHEAGPAEILVWGAVDEWAGESYRQALPGVLGCGLAAPRDEPDRIPAGRTRRVLERAGLPAVVLDSVLLSQLPVEVLLEAVAQPARNSLVRQLALVRRGMPPDTGELDSAAEEFSVWMLETFERTFRPAGGRAWAHLQGERRLMRFGLDEDTVTGQLGAGLETQPSADGRGRGLSFHVLGPRAEDAPREAGAVTRRPARELDPFDRLVTL
ncbi:hypothetical protein ACFP1Z_27885 [Streptomyces gamaensis]|uniref:Uncharacterized protein n=1 Tax=Streptomyces gamaensis TaxID=1763542 RepID=A0ABW0ZAC5_9ACTN